MNDLDVLLFTCPDCGGAHPPDIACPQPRPAAAWAVGAELGRDGPVRIHDALVGGELRGRVLVIDGHRRMAPAFLRRSEALAGLRQAQSAVAKSWGRLVGGAAYRLDLLPRWPAGSTAMAVEWTPERARTVVRDLVRQLLTLHRAGLQHGDLSLQSIRVGPRGEVALSRHAALPVPPGADGVRLPALVSALLSGCPSQEALPNLAADVVDEATQVFDTVAGPRDDALGELRRAVLGAGRR